MFLKFRLILSFRIIYLLLILTGFHMEPNRVMYQ